MYNMQNETDVTHKAIDIVRVVNNGASLSLRSNRNGSKNISTSSDQLVNLQNNRQQYTSSSQRLATNTSSVSLLEY